MQTFGVNIVVIQDNQVLLTLRSDLPVWCLPGGAIEAGESLVEAAKRETHEETGAEVEISRIIAEGNLSIENLVNYFCKTPCENQSKLELSANRYASNGRQ